MSELSPRVGSALDFQGLGELRGQAQRDQRGALRETARQFEAMFLQTIMATMREAGFKSDLVESSTMETFQTMHDKEISLAMTRRGGLGLADMLVEQMERNQMVPAAEALAARQGQGKLGSLEGLARPGKEPAGLPLQSERRALPVQPKANPFNLPDASPKSFEIPRGFDLKSRSGDRR